MSTITIIILAGLLGLAMVRAITYRNQRDSAYVMIADYRDAIAEWESAYNAAILDLASLQDHAYTLQRVNGNGHKSELPLVVGKSATKLIMVDDTPVIKINEFTARNGKTVKLETDKPVETKETATTPALPASESVLASDDTDKVAEVRAEIGKLDSDEIALIEKWEAKRPESVSEYVKRLASRRANKKS